MFEEYRIGQKKAVINHTNYSVSVYHLNGNLLCQKKYSNLGEAKQKFEVWAEIQRLLYKRSSKYARYFFSK